MGIPEATESVALETSQLGVFAIGICGQVRQNVLPRQWARELPSCHKSTSVLAAERI
jgi:hypothetical protein